MTHQRAQVAVIGGGILGTASAYELATAGLDVVLFERRAMAGGTTGGSAGVICLHDMGELYAVMSLIGYERIRWLQREHGFAFHQYGSLQTWTSADGDPGESAFAATYGSDADSIYHRRMMSRRELETAYPWLPENVTGGALFPNQGFINPYELVDLYLRLGRATGRLRVFPGTPVLAVDQDGTAITTLVTRRGPWRVDHVVNAAGPWGAKVSALAGSEISLSAQRIQVAVATAYEDGAHRTPLLGWPETVAGEPGWCRGEEGDTMLFGQHHHVPDPRFTVDPDHVNMANDDTYPAEVAAMIRRHWRLPKARFLPGWNCVYGMTPDGYPIVGTDPTVTNLHHVVGCNGHGVTLHAGLARAVAAQVTEGRTALDLSDVADAPATLETSWLRPGRFAGGSALRFDFDHPTPTDQLVGDRSSP